MNKWKIASFALLGGWLLTLAGGAYLVIDHAVTIGYMKDGYADCEAHRDFLHTLIKGRLSRADIAAAAGSVKWRSDGWQEQTVTKDMVHIQYDQDGRYLSSTFGASTAGPR
ncbi:hypothetical protein [Haliangium sp. UPWRP_2]|uniref:hypothetical protein n=1 Tax=Haliangium sp. UPWRP_2 TaxID=1931276 RepID=UPI000B53E227|nr:hypothetical protein [Haliangium sp. UPWRP_2]PSM31702.1 hypothetical protein BVG81_004045 [Haliangium sp. UPWRP_2]HNN93186.1 hypothetical protein [Pseudomonadota bacterium]